MYFSHFYEIIRFSILLYQLGIIDGLTLTHRVINAGVQYTAIVCGCAGEWSSVRPRVVLKPITGMAVGLKFICIASDRVERAKRVAMLSAVFSTSLTSMFCMDIGANGAMGAVIAENISYMERALNARGGSNCFRQLKPVPLFKLEKLKLFKASSSKIHPYRYTFAANNKIAIDNVFQEHTNRRFLYGSINKLKPSGPSCLYPIIYYKKNTIVLNGLIGAYVFGIGLIIGGGLALFQYPQRRRYRNQNLYYNQNYKSVIDVKASTCD